MTTKYTTEHKVRMDITWVEQFDPELPMSTERKIEETAQAWIAEQGLSEFGQNAGDGVVFEFKPSPDGATSLLCDRDLENWFPSFVGRAWQFSYIVTSVVVDHRVGTW